MDDQYGQLIEPPAVVFGFGAPGWYVLGALAMLLLMWFTGFLWRNYQRNRYRRRALKEIENSKQHYAAAGMEGNMLYETNMLLKRIAMARYGRNDTAGMKGEEWIEFLNKSSGDEIFDETDTALLQELYSGKKHEHKSIMDFIQKAKTWIRKHRHFKPGNKLHHGH
jgi:hypothetical protein